MGNQEHVVDNEGDIQETNQREGAGRTRSTFDIHWTIVPDNKQEIDGRILGFGGERRIPPKNLQESRFCLPLSRMSTYNRSEKERKDFLPKKEKNKEEGERWTGEGDKWNKWRKKKYKRGYVRASILEYYWFKKTSLK